MLKSELILMLETEENDRHARARRGYPVRLLDAKLKPWHDDNIALA